MDDICVKEKDELWNYSFTRDLRFDSILAQELTMLSCCVFRERSFRFVLPIFRARYIDCTCIDVV